MNAAQARDALEAVLEALDIPHGATVGDEETRAKILAERIVHTMVMLRSVLDEEDPALGIPWSVAYLRERLAEHPAEGYKTWDQRTAEPSAATAADAERCEAAGCTGEHPGGAR